VTSIAVPSLLSSSSASLGWSEFLSASNLTIIGTFVAVPMLVAPLPVRTAAAWSTFRWLDARPEFDVERGADEHGMAARAVAAVR